VRASIVSGLVSTIVPVYNRAAMLVEAVESVVSQTYRPIEIIIVDDGSTDEDTLRTIVSLAGKYPEVRAIRRENGGPGAARESGRIAAQGEFIQYLDSDDILLPDKFTLQVRALRNTPDAGVAYGIVRYRDSDGREIACTWKQANQNQRYLFPSILISRWWETASPLFRRGVSDLAGPWTFLRIEEDWEYDARVAALGVQLVFVPEVIAEHRDHRSDRLSRGAPLDSQRLHDRAVAHQLIASHAAAAHIPATLPEMKFFARDLFRLGRLCSAAGLRSDARELLGIARNIAPRWDLIAFQLLATTIGWRNAGRLSLLRERTP